MKKQVIILRILIILVLCFIFGNSLTPADDSLSFSDAVWAAFINFCSHFFDTRELEQFTGVRYLAHFLEFMLLGFLFMLNKGLQKAINHQCCLNVAFFGLTVSLVDETIQIFTPGRSARIDEVWLDLAGYIFGTGIAIITLKLIPGLFGRKNSAPVS